MRFAIIAAGEGSRLASEGVKCPKPLVQIGGECLIDRLTRIFQDNGASEIVVICNEERLEVKRHLEEASIPNLRLVVKSTPSSMHSLWEISPYLQGEPFVLTTVDTIFDEQEFADYLSAFHQLTTSNEIDGLMAVTDYVDDEKPLYVATDEKLQIEGFHDDYRSQKYISGGIYGLLPQSLDTLRRCMERGDSRMRNFQRALIADGLRLKAHPFSKILDIDHQKDVAEAEKFIACLRH